jgi:hypothetical protein
MASPATLQDRRVELCRTRDYLFALHHARAVPWSEADMAEYNAVITELHEVDAKLSKAQAR